MEKYLACIERAYKRQRELLADNAREMRASVSELLQAELRVLRERPWMTTPALINTRSRLNALDLAVTHPHQVLLPVKPQATSCIQARAILTNDARLPKVSEILGSSTQANEQKESHLSPTDTPRKTTQTYNVDINDSSTTVVTASQLSQLEAGGSGHVNRLLEQPTTSSAGNGRAYSPISSYLSESSRPITPRRETPPPRQDLFLDQTPPAKNLENLMQKFNDNKTHLVRQTAEGLINAIEAGMRATKSTSPSPNLPPCSISEPKKRKGTSNRLTKAEIEKLPAKEQEQHWENWYIRNERAKKAVKAKRKMNKKKTAQTNFEVKVEKGTICSECKEPGHQENPGWRRCTVCEIFHGEEICIPKDIDLERYVCGFCRRDQ